MRKIETAEPLIFIFFGCFHLHRVWGLVDRQSYAAFWLGLMTRKGPLYVFLMGALAALCLWGIRLFLKYRHLSFWWRWVYVLGGGYVLFDLLAITSGWTPWLRLLSAMFDTAAPYWNLLWGAFVLLGAGSLGLGVSLLITNGRGDQNA